MGSLVGPDSLQSAVEVQDGRMDDVCTQKTSNSPTKERTFHIQTGVLILVIQGSRDGPGDYNDETLFMWFIILFFFGV